MDPIRVHRSRLDTITSLCLIAASASMIWFIAFSTVVNRNGATANTRRNQTVQEMAGQLTISINGNPQLGRPDATIALIEYSDFECPFCRRYARDVFPALQREFVANGKIRYAYRHLPLIAIHPHAMEAAAAAECAQGEGRFWDMHRKLFDSSSLTQPSLLEAGAQLGIERSRLASCITIPSPQIQSDVAEAARLGISSTPTFLVGLVSSTGIVDLRHRISGAQPLEVFASVINDLAKSARR